MISPTTKHTTERKLIENIPKQKAAGIETTATMAGRRIIAGVAVAVSVAVRCRSGVVCSRRGAIEATSATTPIAASTVAGRRRTDATAATARIVDLSILCFAMHSVGFWE